MNIFTAPGLKKEIQRAIEELGFVEPTPIQAEVIPAILETEDDIIGLAQTGTGKTAAFGLPLISQTDTTIANAESLILCPTRELCMQICKDLDNFGKYTKGFKAVPVYGGSDIQRQIKAIKGGAQIIVGTPGRTLDLIKRKVIKTGLIQHLVLDEADEMLNMGFKEDLDEILEGTPDHKRTYLFSATMPKEIRRIASQYMNEAVEISAGEVNTGTKDVSHEYFMVNARDRYLALKRIADINPNMYSIVFCRTRMETKDVADKLIQDGYNADALHGDLSQAQRDHVMGRFRSKHLQILVATDVAARGLDVNDLTHVVNYNLPDDLEAYIHRSGRTGRAGKKGISIAIIHSREGHKIRDLERMASVKFERKMVPNGREICEKQLFSLIDRVEHVDVENHEIEQFLPVIYEKLEWLSREELIKHFVSVEFNRFLEYYKSAPDLNIKKDDRMGKREKKATGARNRSDANFSRMFINIGAMDHMNTARLIGVINDYTRDRNIRIGKIDIMKKFSFFEVESGAAEHVLRSFKNVDYKGHRLNVELSKPDPKSQDSYRKRDKDNWKKDRGEDNWKKDRGDDNWKKDRGEGGWKKDKENFRDFKKKSGGKKKPSKGGYPKNR